MPNLDLRNYYFSQKHKYVFFHTFLIVFRCIGLLMFGSILLFVILFSSLTNGNDGWIDAFYAVSKVVRIVVPIVVSLWIASKVIVVILRKKLLKIKEEAGVLDEI